MSKHPVCVRRAATPEEAAIIATWLADQGIEATVVDPDNPGVMAFGVTDPEGIAICVADDATAERATKCLEAHDRRRADRAVADEVVEVRCSKCGATNRFSGSQRGTVQSCAECSEYLDVPTA